MENYKITLRAIRTNMNKSQKEMAVLYGVSEATLSNWEKGKTYPTVEDIPRIEKATGLPYENIDFLVKNYD